MDNDAFRALVQERSRAKSSKEIAREAVEEEFEQRKRKRAGGSRNRRGGGSEGYSSESDGGGRSDYDDSDDDGDKKKKSNDDDNDDSLNQPFKKQQKIKKYRDRAKERREGTNSDYKAAQALLAGISSSAATAGPPIATSTASSVPGHLTTENENDGNTMDEATLSKYLGGDEAHTHLVKGLDVALARRIKHEIQQGGGDHRSPSSTIDLDKLHTTALRQQHRRQQHEQSVHLSETAEDALQFIQLSDSKSMATELGQAMLIYLQRTRLPRKKTATIDREREIARLEEGEVSTTAAGLAIQRSNLVFSTQPHPSDVTTAWETPREMTLGNNQKAHRRTATTSHADKESRKPATYLDRFLIKRIQNALLEHHNDVDSHEENRAHGNKKKKHPPKVSAAKPSRDKSKNSFSGYNINNRSDKETPSSSDEEDIFANAGDYTGPSGQSLSRKNENKEQEEETNNKTFASSTKKTSIFSGLLVPSTTAFSSKISNARNSAASNLDKKGASLPSSKTPSVVDRDVLGARPSNGDKRGKHKTTVQGVSVAYQGGYGEEMDVDFDGRFADDDKEEESKKKGGQDELTIGLKEYGRRGGGGHQHGNPDDF